MTGAAYRVRITDAATWLELLERVLHGVPRLPGAACRDADPRLFDGVTPEDAAAAKALCAACPALADCADWSATLLPSRRLHGIVAGKRYGARRRHTATMEAP